MFKVSGVLIAYKNMSFLTTDRLFITESGSDVTCFGSVLLYIFYTHMCYDFFSRLYRVFKTEVAKVRSKGVKVDTCAADVEKINGTLGEHSTEV